MKSITKAEPEEAGDVSDVFLAARRGMTYLPKIHTDYDTRRYISGLVNSKKIYVIKENGIIAGLMMVDNGFLHHLYIGPKFHGKGYGKLLLDKAKELSPESLSLWVFEDNTGAIKFYEREGFQLLEKRDKDQADNEENLSDRKYFWKK